MVRDGFTHKHQKGVLFKIEDTICKIDLNGMINIITIKFFRNETHVFNLNF